MDSIRTTKEILKEWCERNLDTHTDWVGTRVETVNEMESIDEFVDKLWDYLVCHSIEDECNKMG